MGAIFKRDFTSYFNSAIGYITMAVFFFSADYISIQLAYIQRHQICIMFFNLCFWL